MREQLTFNEKLKKKVVEQELKDAEEMRGRNRYYNQFFENWLEYEVSNPKGKKRILRIYDGSWYTQDLKDNQRRLLKLMYLAMWVGALLLFCFAALQRTDGNHAKYVMFTEGLGLVGLVVNAYPLLIYVITPPKMTIGEYRTSSMTLQWTARFSSICQASASAAMLLHILFQLFTCGGNVITELLCSLLFLLSAAFIHGMWRIEKDIVKYNTSTSKATAPLDGEKIRDRDLTY